MPVFRIDKNTNYTVISNYHLRDKRLSYKAKGLLSFMLSLPDDWDYSINGLVSISKESIRAIRNILKELQENNYLVINKIKNEKGQFEYEYLIYEKPDVHFVDMDNPHMENDIQINTNKQNTNNKDKTDKTFQEICPVNENNKLTLELIKKGYIKKDDVDVIYYNSLFEELLQIYDYKDIIVSIHYILKHLKENDYKDENSNEIKNKYGYFKEAIYNNLINMTTEIGLGY